MLKGIKDHLAAKLQRQMIESAVRTLYSEEFEFETILSHLSKNRDGIHLLRAAVAIEAAARLQEPLTAEDTKMAQMLVERVAATQNSEQFNQLVSIRKELAEFFWSKATLNILRQKIAYKRCEESFEGTMYSIARDQKAPVSSQQRLAFEKVCAELDIARKNVEVAELDALLEQDPEEYTRYKVELEALDMQREIELFEQCESDLNIYRGIHELEQDFYDILDGR